MYITCSVANSSAAHVRIVVDMASACVPAFLLATNLFRLPVASWHDNTAGAPPNLDNASSAGEGGRAPLPAMNYSCGCWDTTLGARWIQMTLRGPASVYGVEATLGHPFDVALSLNGTAWSSPVHCLSSPCVFPAGPTVAQHVRILVGWFDAWADTPRFRGSVLGCRFHVRQGLGRATSAAPVGQTSTLFVVARDVFAPSASPPNISAIINGSALILPAHSIVPLNCSWPTANSSNSNRTTNSSTNNNSSAPAVDASVAWARSALRLPPWAPSALLLLQERLLGACAALLSAQNPGAGPLVWLAHIDLPAWAAAGASPPSACAVRPEQSFQSSPARHAFRLMVSEP